MDAWQYDVEQGFTGLQKGYFVTETDPPAIQCETMRLETWSVQDGKMESLERFTRTAILCECGNHGYDD